MRLVRLVVVAAVAASLPLQGQDQPPDPQRPPTFRTGAHYVRVDAYPTRDGKPIPGLSADDFELLEDGRPQAIDRVEFIDHPAWTPLGERRDPNSQRDGFELARRPDYRVFVLYLDSYHVDFTNSVRSKVSITEMLNRMMGPKDLFGVLTPAQTPKDLLLGQLTQSIEEQLAKLPYWGIDGRYHPEPGEIELEFLFPGETGKRIIALRRLDKVYSDLEELVSTLGALRDERKNVIFFSDTLHSPRSRFRDVAMGTDSRGGRPPAIGVDDKGTLTMGSRHAGDPDRTKANAEAARLQGIDFDQRFRELLTRARQANVAFYTVRPAGLDMSSSAMNDSIGNLRVLANETDGVPVLDTNDLRAGVAKIADDLSSHYVLGYYTSNTRWDGRPRKITVRLKGTGQAVRARREYRAPTEAEMTAIRDARTAAAGAPAAPSPEKAALSALARISPSARVQAYGVPVGNEMFVVTEVSAPEIESGRWKAGAEVQVLLTDKAGQTSEASGRIEPGARASLVKLPAEGGGPWQAVVKVRGADTIGDADTIAVERPRGPLLGKPLAHRAASAAASAYRPMATFQFRRTERLRLQWPLLVPALDSHAVRLLDRNGKPLAVPVPATVGDLSGAPALTADLNLAPLSIGEYLVEVQAKAGDRTEQQMIAIRVAMAR